MQIPAHMKPHPHRPAMASVSTPPSEIQVHYGHLCTVRVTKFDIVEAFGGSKAASVVFQVQANKTRAYRSFPIRVAYETDLTPSAAVRAAWKQLTGHDVSPDAETSDETPTAGQAATLAEIKEFVRSETQKLGVDLTLDVV